MAMLFLNHVKVAGVILPGLRSERQEFRCVAVAVDQMGERTSLRFRAWLKAEAFMDRS
jgi:hypothetical protein